MQCLLVLMGPLRVAIKRRALSAAGCNTVSTAEQAVLCILSVVRNYPTGHRQIVGGRWDLAEASSTAYDLEGKHVGRAAPLRLH